MVDQEKIAGSGRVASALWFVGPKVAALRSEVIADPAPDEIQVRAIHSLISPGSELNLYRGEGNLPDLLLPTAKGALPFPIKFAYQTVGEVIQAGISSGFRCGEKIFAAHPHQDIFNIAASPPLVHRIPAGVDLLSAQFSTMFSVSLQVLLQRPVRPGEVVVVSGLGLVGSFAAYLARLCARRLIVIDPLVGRRDRAKWIGADALVSPADASQCIRDLSEGCGADLFIETSGAPAALQTAIVNTAVMGTVAVAAWYGTRPVHLSLSPEFHLRSLKIVSVYVLNDDGFNWSPARKFLTSLDYLRRIDLRPLVTHRFPFEKAPEAYRMIDEASAESLGVLLEHS